MTGWGSAPVPLVPATLRKAWHGQPLPRWVAIEAGLGPDGTLDELDSRVWSRTHRVTNRLENFVVALVQSREQEIANLPALPSAWPADLDPADVKWKPRTRNCLSKVGALENPTKLGEITYRDLFAIPGMGTRSVLDFAATSERAFGSRVVTVPQEEVDLQDLISRIMGSSWVDLIADEDPRFLPLLSSLPGKGSLSQRIEVIEETEMKVSAAKVLTEIADQVGRIEKFPLEVALKDYVESLTSTERQAEVVMVRLGLQGEPPKTLEETGIAFGLTRERVRQIQHVVEGRVPSYPVFMPALDRALAILSKAAPLSRSQAMKLLIREGVTGVDFAPESLLSAAAFCGRPETLSLERGPKTSTLVAKGSFKRAGSIIQIARRQANAYGASNIKEVEAVLTREGIEVDEATIHGVLKNQSNLEFLDDFWFWAPDTSAERNRLVSQTRKMLSVVSPMSLAVIREGLRRKYAFHGVPIVPPRSVLAAVYRAHPDFVVDDDGMVRSVQLLDYRAELGFTDRVLVETLRQSPTGLLDRESLVEACTAKGMNWNTLATMLTYSSVVDHVATDVYAVRGTHIDPAALEAIREANSQRPRERRVEDHGWTADGNLWVAVRLPRWSQSLVIGIPSAIVRYVIDRHFRAVAEDGSNAGTIGVNQMGSSYGYGPFLTRRGAEEGDILRIEFDLAREEAHLAIADSELLERVG